jgi:hypothetical protein
MPCLDRLLHWKDEVSTAFGHLSKPQVWGLVLWSVGKENKDAWGSSLPKRLWTFQIV